MHQNVINPSENCTNSIAEKLGVFRTKVMKHQDLVRFRVSKPRIRSSINFDLSIFLHSVLSKISLKIQKEQDPKYCTVHVNT